MKYKLIIRKIQLYKLGYGNKPKELEALERMKGLTERKGCYYNDNGDKILYYNKKINVVFINFNEIWSIFKSEFNMKYKDIKSLTKWYIDREYNLKYITTSGFDNNHHFTC